MKISVTGNCQTKALSWYIQQLNNTWDVKWVCPEFWMTEWGKDPTFEGKPINLITDIKKGVERFQDSDYIIYQHLSEGISKNFTEIKLKKYGTKSKLTSISSFYYEPDDLEQKYLKGMIERAEKFNIDIPAHKIIEKHGSKIGIRTFNHPKVFYFLELVREICKRNGWEYYNNEQYNQYLEDAYPFG